MDWRNEEADYFDVDNFVWNENSFSSKTKSELSLGGTVTRNVCSKEVQVSFVNCKESRSFTSAFEQLELSPDSKDSTERIHRTCDAQTDFLYTREDEHATTSFQTRQIPSLRLVVQGPEVLNYQGKTHSPQDIALYWKKDARKWLWKSEAPANKRNELISSTFSEESDEDFKRFQ